MGTSQRKENLKKSPLGCILQHWKEIGEPPGGSVNKRTLVKYCNQWWPLYKLDDEAKWPENGTLDYNTLLQLMLFLRREGKWDEVSYADMFFTLRNHPEWQKESGINLAPQDPLVLALERDRKKELGKLKRCCSACSIGQRCLKTKGNRKNLEECMEDFVSPLPLPDAGSAAGTPARADRDESSYEGGTPSSRSSPISAQTCSKVGPIIQAPLRQAMGPGGRP